MKRARFLPLALAVLAAFPAACLAGPVAEGRAAFARQDHAAALRHFSEASGAERPAGLYYRARMLELGLGVAADRAEAIDLYRQSAEAGHPAALNRVGLMFHRGEDGAAKDPARAFEMFSRAEKKGDANAAFNLGKLYFEGEGVRRDMARALALYRTAAEGGHVLALNTMGALTKEADPARSRDYYARSAERGNAVGLFETGLSHLHAGARAESLRAAHRLLNLAAARGHVKAAEVLKALTTVMRPEDVIAAQAEARTFQPKEAMTDE